MEVFIAWYSGNTYEQFMQINRTSGPVLAHVYWSADPLQLHLAVQCLWFQRVRPNVPLLFVISIVVNVGMWLERFVIVVTSLHRDFLPAAWEMYHPTIWDWATFIGTIGLFLTLLFLFIRFLPVISISEMRELVHETQEHGRGPRPRADADGAWSRADERDA